MQEPLTYQCPFCDHEVRVGKSCPGCTGKQKPAPRTAKKSWRQDATYDGLELPDEDFDYDEFVASEFGHLPHKKIGVKWYWWLLGVALLILMALFAAYGMGALSATETTPPTMSQVPSPLQFSSRPWEPFLTPS